VATRPEVVDTCLESDRDIQPITQAPDVPYSDLDRFFVLTRWE
jgi:hypothetical protein